MGGQGKGRCPLVSKGEGRATNRGTELGKQGWVSSEVYGQEDTRKDSLGAHTLVCVDAHIHAELGLPFLHLPT